MRKILIPTKLNTVAADILAENQFDVVQDADTDLDELVAAHGDAFGLIVRSEKITADIIDKLPNLNIIVRAGAGYDSIDIKYARKKNIDVMNTPGANSNAVAEEVVALALAAYRKLVPADISTRQGLWEKKKFMGREVTGKTVGIVGLGNIGQLVIKRLQGFDVRCIGYDPMISSQRAEDIGVELMSVEDVFAEADIITLHVPETDETRGMVNKDLLSNARDGVMIINCARAGIINEDDLAALKDEKRIIYCNDVYPKDAAGEKSIAPLSDIMAPHLGASTEEANMTAAKRAAEQIVAYVEQGIDTYVVNRGVPSDLDSTYPRLAYYLTKVASAYLGKGSQPRRIEASFYGDLKQFEKWLLPPIVLGLSSDFDPTFDHDDAASYLEKMGIIYESRDVNDDKNYGSSITIDLMEGDGQNFSKASIRGTVAEGHIMVSRINGFDKLYFEPHGNSVMVQYTDSPGILAKITPVLAKHGINIDDIRAPQDTRTGETLAVIIVNQEVSDDILNEIKEASGACRTVALSLK